VNRSDHGPLNERDAAAGKSEPEEDLNEIRQSIEHTRAEMSETIGQLQERLSPSHLKEQVRMQVKEQYEHAKDSVRDATLGKVQDMVDRAGDTFYETRRGIVETVTANPIPAALAGIGLAWLWMNRRDGSDGASTYRGRRSSQRYNVRSRGYPDYDASTRWREGDDSDRGNLATRATEAISGVASQAQETASHLAGKAKETVSEVVGQAQETAGQLMHRAQYQARRVEDTFNDTLRDSPLAVGAVALALGAAVGLAVPRTRTEDEWLGDARDALVDKAQAVAHDTMEQVQDVAQKVTIGKSGNGGSSTTPQGERSGPT